MQILQTLTLHQYPDVGREPDICFGQDNYLVVWSQGEFGGEFRVRAARVSPSGAVLDTGIVCGMDHYCEYRPAVDFDGDRFLVVWYNYVDLPAGVFGRFVDQECIPVGREFQIRDLPVNTSNDPDIAFLDSVYMVVWNEPSPYSDDDVYGQIVHKNGTLINDVIPIAVDSAYQYQARVCAGDTMFIVIWHQETYVYGQFVASDGTLIGGHFPISDPPPHPRDFPDIAYGGPQPLTVWQEFVGGDHNIYGDLELFTLVDERISCPAKDTPLIPAIVSGALALPAGTQYRIFDITGQHINTIDPAPGVYFIEIDQTSFHKVTKIR
jgi:hypothetical protein